MFQAFRDVAKFEAVNGNPVSDRTPEIPDPETVYLRNDLHTEEFDELCEAMAAGDMTEIADGIGDLIWVLLGTAVRFGIDMTPVWEAIRQTNMAKFGPGARRRADGKLLKPADWIAPDIEGILRAQPPLSIMYPLVAAVKAASVPQDEPAEVALVD